MPNKYGDRTGSDNLADFIGQANRMSQLSQQAGDEALRQAAGKRQDLKNKTAENDQLAKNKMAEQQNQSDLDSASRKASLKDAMDALTKLPKGYGVGVTKEGAEIKGTPALATFDLKKQQHDDGMVEKYSKSLKPYGDITAAYNDLDRITNRDGNGGVISNPNATLISTGKIHGIPIAGLSDKALGLAEAAGLVPLGTAEERKAITRIQQGIGVALGGARGMSPGVQDGIKNATGMITSGDPNLVAKGLRSTARNMGTQIQWDQAGYSPDIRSTAHVNSGMDDPAMFYRNVAMEKPVGTFNPRGGQLSKTAPPQQTAAPGASAQAAPPSAPPAGGFDPDAYLKGN